MTAATSTYVNAEADEIINKTGNFQTRYTRTSEKKFIIIDSYNGVKTAVALDMSAQGYAILPLDVFDKTVDPKGPSDSSRKSWFENISKQLSTTGTCKSLISFDNGNGVGVTWTIGKDPKVITFDDVFMKSGSFSESSYFPILKGATSWSTTGYGTPSKKEKWIL
jgi:hypothetical protein